MNTTGWLHVPNGPFVGENDGMGVPRVSVVIPTYNRAHLVADAVRSVLDQQGVEVEVAVVDDGSTDNTSDVLAELARSDSRVMALRQENAGPSAARNTGIAATTAPLVAFLDSDDLMVPADRLAIQAAYLAEHSDAGLVIGTGDVVVMDGVEPPWLVVNQRDAGVPGWVVMTMMVHRTLLEAVDGFETTMRIAEDTDLVARLIDAGAGMGKIETHFVVRRIFGDNLISTITDNGAVFDVIRRHRQRQATISPDS